MVLVTSIKKSIKTLSKYSIIDFYFDLVYGINTCKLDPLLKNRIIHYNYEPSKYFFLKKLFKKYPFAPRDHLVDFGCGKGRVLIFAASNSCKVVTGVEVNKDMHNISVENAQRFKKKYPDIKFNICIQNIDATKLEIDKNMNKFFFFNPFHLKIFIYVIKQISNSIKQNNRKIMLFLNKPQLSTLRHIESLNEYVLVEMSENPQYAVYTNIVE